MNGVLNRESIAGFQRWELPLVGEAPAPAPAPAEETPRPTVSDLEALERQAREEGYAAGHAEGLAAAQRELAARLAQFDALLAAAARPLAALDESVEQELARLAMVAARQVIAHELKTDPAVVAAAVRQAALALPAATRELRVYLHPDDLALLRVAGAVESHWRLLPDPSLARGDCRMESESSRLDARVETRLAAVIDAVLGADGDDGGEEVGA